MQATQTPAAPAIAEPEIRPASPLVIASVSAPRAAIAPKATPIASPAHHDHTLSLTRAMSRGDADAVSAFYESNFERALAIARRATGRDESFCLDVVQDAMIRIVRTIKPISDHDTLMCWMARIVRSAAIDTLRREARRTRREQSHASRGSDGHIVFPGSATAAERAELLARTLDQLSPEDRSILGLRFIHDGTLEQVAQTIGGTGPAVHGRIRRLVSRLRAAAAGDHP